MNHDRIPLRFLGADDARAGGPAITIAAGTGAPARPPDLGRRDFLKNLAAGAGGLTAAGALPGAGRLLGAAGDDPLGAAAARADYRGPNVILVRFGGGVRRRETIDPEHTYAPYLRKVMAARGTLYRNMEIEDLKGVETSHGQGTLYILSGRYNQFTNVSENTFGERFESKVPTVFEYLRKAYAVQPHQTLIINGEDRTDEEFFTFSNHHLFGARFRSSVLSLYRFKVFLLRRQIEAGAFREAELERRRRELDQMESLDHRTGGEDRQSPEIERFWEGWRGHYGESGLVNGRGDRLLTELSVRALRELRPRLMMINYNDPDYVHWGNQTHYTRGIRIIDEGLERLVATVESEEFYRGNTIFVVVPDCGRDSNPFVKVPFQHHFNSKSARQIWCLVAGPGIARGLVVDRRVDQTCIAGTVGRAMGFSADLAEGAVLEEVFA